MNPLVLYTNPQSRGRIAHWMLEEIGLSYETVWLDYGASMKAADYLAINPMGKVPALRHGDAVVTEAAAICAYLADCFPAKNLIPPPAHASRAPYYRWLFFAAGPLEAAVTAKALGWQVPAGKGVIAGFGSYPKTLDALQTAPTPGPYICGEQFTAADVYVGSSLAWGLLFGSIEARPIFTAYAERLRARPAAQQADRINEAFFAAQQALS